MVKEYVTGVDREGRGKIRLLRGRLWRIAKDIDEIAREWLETKAKIELMTKEIDDLKAKKKDLESEIVMEAERIKSNLIETDSYVIKISKWVQAKGISYKEAFEYLMSKVNSTLRKMAEEFINKMKQEDVRVRIDVLEKEGGIVDTIKSWWEGFKDWVVGHLRSFVSIFTEYKDELAELAALADREAKRIKGADFDIGDIVRVKEDIGRIPAGYIGRIVAKPGDFDADPTAYLVDFGYVAIREVDKLELLKKGRRKEGKSDDFDIGDIVRVKEDVGRIPAGAIGRIVAKPGDVLGDPTRYTIDFDGYVTVGEADKLELVKKGGRKEGKGDNFDIGDIVRVKESVGNLPAGAIGKIIKKPGDFLGDPTRYTIDFDGFITVVEDERLELVKKGS